MRALNLVWALRKSSIEIGSAAMVGGGVAGVTAGCALAGCSSSVELSEEAMTPMWRQSATAHHRVVHRRINQWSVLDDPEDMLLPVTDLPFLNWHVCDDVISMTRRDLDHFADRITFSWSTLVSGDRKSVV